MRAHIKGYSSPDVDLDDFTPDDPECFAFLLEAYVGPEGGNGGETLGFTVCTPGHLSRLVDEIGTVPGHGLVITKSCKIDEIVAFVERMILRQTGGDWRAVAKNLGRIGIMEFDDPIF
ncbi:Imm8 family immunity protein [Kitasatospora sp. NPDC057940]|uniref:Imm8 family immunity protein n=1 Tax=Kitasatospora sp. NPDC057940 TaxID=3346285 RepID=UPI0036D76819